MDTDPTTIGVGDSLIITHGSTTSEGAAHGTRPLRQLHIRGAHWGGHGSGEKAGLTTVIRLVLCTMWDIQMLSYRSRRD
ncbi:hypothetical protein VN97_g10665 [Penicillium thymicola]|uniref:Uncharacterized protein n=1 Tax=Penicillium thymicola TaxID=293382 RepID=A0AAI9T8K2_PENTH|nr:hypothetical protein VN97_g10665 [Penicillium thymicola]